MIIKKITLYFRLPLGKIAKRVLSNGVLKEYKKRKQMTLKNTYIFKEHASDYAWLYLLIAIEFRPIFFYFISRGLMYAQCDL